VKQGVGQDLRSKPENSAFYLCCGLYATEIPEFFRLFGPWEVVSGIASFGTLL